MSVASKNLFALLGNDDGDETPSGPVKTVDKNSTRTTKRNVEPQAPAKPVGATGGNRRGGLTGSEGAFRDRDAGSSNNQRKTTDEAYRGGGRGGRGARERGGRGGRFPRGGDDRQSRTAPGGGSEKQAAQSWGATEGEAERQDEQAGEEIAQTEQKEALAEDAQDDALAEAESKNVSYADYLAQQAEKKLALSEGLEIRKPDAKVDKKWANAKPLSKEDDDDFISGSAGKAKRERERKTKQVVDIDQRYVEPDRPTRGGPRGGGRGGGRGEGRGDFRGGPRGGGRGGEGRGRGGPRGEGRGGRGGRENAAPINTQDKSAFPSLGQ